MTLSQFLILHQTVCSRGLWHHHFSDNSYQLHSQTDEEPVKRKENNASLVVCLCLSEKYLIKINARFKDILRWNFKKEYPWDMESCSLNSLEKIKQTKLELVHC